MMETPLKDTRILVIEDDGLSALVAREMLGELGCRVAGVASSVDAALAAIENGGAIDCVMLDVAWGPNFERHCDRIAQKERALRCLQRLRHQIAGHEYPGGG